MRAAFANGEVALTWAAAFIFVSLCGTLLVASIPTSLYLSTTTFSYTPGLPLTIIRFADVLRVVATAFLPVVLVLALLPEPGEERSTRAIRVLAVALLALVILALLGRPVFSQPVLAWLGGTSAINQTLLNLILITVGLAEAALLVHLAVLTTALAARTPQAIWLPRIAGLVVFAAAYAAYYLPVRSGFAILSVAVLLGFALRQALKGRLPEGCLPWLWAMAIAWGLPIALSIGGLLVEALSQASLWNRYAVFVNGLPRLRADPTLAGNSAILLSLCTLAALERGGPVRRWDWVIALVLGVILLQPSYGLYEVLPFPMSPRDAWASAPNPLSLVTSVLLWAVDWASLAVLPAIAAWLYLTWDRPAPPEAA